MIRFKREHANIIYGIRGGAIIRLKREHANIIHGIGGGGDYSWKRCSNSKWELHHIIIQFAEHYLLGFKAATTLLPFLQHSPPLTKRWEHSDSFPFCSFILCSSFMNDPFHSVFFQSFKKVDFLPSQNCSSFSIYFVRFLTKR